ncbi:Uncharacterised protein [Legionella busanensis]|uniref:Cyclodipeptide synthase n=1 Tax=Legionella busanensis TaxID=190655 RepID=A0A378JJY3_9GAMM|nr:tRNA-dependent cyclodipeptide synthase [Legionella busanensis]STX50998.1 Uncharacterised protein [Legionella busanensis]
MSGLFSIKSLNEISNADKHIFNTHKASFRADFEIDDKANFFRGKKAVLFISVGQAYHESGKFLSTIKLLNKYDFKSIDLMMADTLQRHNFMGAMGRQAAYEYTQNAGDLWLKRNQFSLEQLALEHQIIRWDELLAHKDYAKYRKLIDEHYNLNADYREALTVNASAYIERLKAINPNVEEEELLANGLEYLIEEMPIVMPMWANMGYDVIIYPKPLTVGMKKTYEVFIKDVYPDKCLWVYLRFKKEKSSNFPQLKDDFFTDRMDAFTTDENRAV